MPSTDWPQGDTIPPIVSSSDLFDGDILGDELIDIYNAAVVGAGDDTISDIPTLLSPGADEKKDAADDGHSGARVVVAAAAIDDGLGAFRPSTSFNDLTTLLPPSNASVGPSSGDALCPLPPQSGTSKTIKAAPPADKKRGLGKEYETPASKRRAPGSRRNSAGGNSPAKKSKCPTTPATPKDKAFSLSGSHGRKPPVQKTVRNDTPNPLSSGEIPHPKTGILPAVVSPRSLNRDETNTKQPAAAGPTSSPPVTATEADFKSVAQAAVTSLIISAGSVCKAEATGEVSSLGQGKVDTSTEHIKALTGSNWVAVCTGETGQSSTAAAADKVNNRARRQNLTPDERARQNRDRNREHARNTRLRKKAYVEELKRTLTELVAQRDASEVEKRHSAQRELEQREVRFRVIEEFLKLRGRNEPNYSRWAAILEDNFCLTLPLTSFRKMVAPSSQDCTQQPLEQIITGVSETMADSSHFASFLQTVGSSAHGKTNSVSFAYSCERKNFFMDCCNAVLDWTGCSNGAIENGAQGEIELKGSFHASFSPASNKLVAASIVFDTGCVSSQLQYVTSSKSHGGGGEASAAAAAAEVAASEADAILDSLQMPHIETAVPSNVNVVLPSCSGSSSGASMTSLDKEDSSDESVVGGLGDAVARARNAKLLSGEKAPKGL